MEISKSEPSLSFWKKHASSVAGVATATTHHPSALSLRNREPPVLLDDVAQERIQRDKADFEKDKRPLEDPVPHCLEILEDELLKVKQGKLQEILLEDLKLIEIPVTLQESILEGVLNHVKFVSLAGNQLSVVSPMLQKLPLLEALCIERNRLRTFPELKEASESLQRLHLYDNHICKLPSDISCLTSLQRLFLDKNRITSLPPEIGCLKNLIWLSLDHNKLEMLPPEIGQLTRLGWLSIENNFLQSLPYEIGNLKSLQGLSVLGNSSLRSLPATFVKLVALVDFREDSVFRLPREVAAADPKSIIEYLWQVVDKHSLRFEKKGHWLPDNATTKCFKCHSSFTVTNRRHHCRLCGRIFCRRHCSNKVEVPVMKSVRTCDICLKALGVEPTVEYGLTQADDVLTEEEKRVKLQNQLKRLAEEIKAEKRKEEGIKKLILAYSTHYLVDKTNMELHEHKKK